MHQSVQTCSYPAPCWVQNVKDGLFVFFFAKSREKSQTKRVTFDIITTKTQCSSVQHCPVFCCIVGVWRKPCFTVKALSWHHYRETQTGSRHGFRTIWQDARHRTKSAGYETCDLEFRDLSRGFTASFTTVQLHGGAGSRLSWFIIFNYKVKP